MLSTKSIRTFICIFTLAGSASSYSSSSIQSDVDYVGRRGDGELFINVNTVIDELNCNTKRISIPASHPQINSFLSIAMVAYSTNTRVTLKTNGCNKGHPTLDTTDGTWFHLVPKY